MNTPSGILGDAPLNPEASAPARMNATRPFYWSVRRELWENRSIFIAPISAAALVLLGFAIGARRLPEAMNTVLLMPADQQRLMLERPYAFCSFLVIIITFIVGIFYCLDALYGERRDRSILFWKSLPVSDLTTVMSKAFIPIVMIPVVAFVIIVVLQVALLLFSAGIFISHGVSAAPLWTQMHVVQMPLLLMYGLLAVSLWYAPLYGYLMLVSAWAKRAPFLWAVLPPLGLVVMEKLAFSTTYFASFLGYRLAGPYAVAFVPGVSHNVMDDLAMADPMKFVTTPGLWLGLIAAAAIFAGVIWMRRYREPI